MHSIKYTEHYTDIFTQFKEVMRIISNIYHTCVPNKIKSRRNIDQLKQHDTVIIACFIWGIINSYTSQSATYRAVYKVLFPIGDFSSRSRFTRLSLNLAYTLKIIDGFPSLLCKLVRNRAAKLVTPPPVFKGGGVTYIIDFSQFRSRSVRNKKTRVSTRGRNSFSDKKFLRYTNSGYQPHTRSKGVFFMSNDDKSLAHTRWNCSIT